MQCSSTRGGQGTQEAGEACGEDLLHGRIAGDDRCKGRRPWEYSAGLPSHVRPHMQALLCWSSAEPIKMLDGSLI